MQMTRLGSSMIPGLLAKSWYLTMCSRNLSGSVMSNIRVGLLSDSMSAGADVGC